MPRVSCSMAFPIHAALNWGKLSCHNSRLKNCARSLAATSRNSHDPIPLYIPTNVMVSSTVSKVVRNGFRPSTVGVERGLGGGWGQAGSDLRPSCRPSRRRPAAPCKRCWEAWEILPYRSLVWWKAVYSVQNLHDGIAFWGYWLQNRQSVHPPPKEKENQKQQREQCNNKTKKKTTCNIECVCVPDDHFLWHFGNHLCHFLFVL